MGSKFFQGDGGILEAGQFIRELAGSFEVVELAHDPWRAQQLALELEAEGMQVVAIPQSPSRMIPAARRLYRAVTEGRITHANDPHLNHHVASAVVRDTARGWLLERPDRSTPIDGVVSLAMCVERAEAKPEPVRLLGWL